MGRKRRKNSRSTRRSFGRHKKSPETIFWIVLIAVIALSGTGFFVHNTLFSSWGASASEQDQNQPVAVEVEEPNPEQENDHVWEPKKPDGQKNILLLGLDDRGMSDLIMIISYDLSTYESALLSIKRDTFVSNQDWAPQDSGQDHLAWANNRGMGQNNDYHAGARLAAKTVEDLLDIDLHAYASITLDGFIRLVDYIGGVEITVAPEFSERGLPTGLQQLDGKQALIYSRHRQNPRIPEPGSASQHEDRVLRNQHLLKGMLEQCKTMETEQLMKVTEQLDDKLYTSLEDWDILDLLNLLYNQDPEGMETAVLPGEGEIIYQERIDSKTYYYFPDFEETDHLLQRLGLK